MSPVFMPLASLLLLGPMVFSQNAAIPAPTAQYTPDGAMQRPDRYREWIYLSTGFDMSYNPAMRMGQHLFNNVFVNPEAYRAYLASGTWPDKAVLVLEVRGAMDKGSINKAGRFQGTGIMGLEVHVKDAARFAGQWAFYSFESDRPAKMIPQSADCYSCHTRHAAVDTTFVQFYPTLLPIAQARGTLSASYKRDVAESEHK